MVVIRKFEPRDGEAVSALIRRTMRESRTAATIRLIAYSR